MTFTLAACHHSDSNNADNNIIPSPQPIVAGVSFSNQTGTNQPMSVNEGNGVCFDLTRDDQSELANPLTVELSSVDGSAKLADSDYSLPSNRLLTIPAQTMSQHLCLVSTKKDGVFNPSAKTFQLKLQNPQAPANLGKTTVLYVAIANIDPAPPISILQISYQVAGTSDVLGVVQQNYYYGQSVTLTAPTFAGYRFREWDASGDLHAVLSPLRTTTVTFTVPSIVETKIIIYYVRTI